MTEFHFIHLKIIMNLLNIQEKTNNLFKTGEIEESITFLFENIEDSNPKKVEIILLKDRFYQLMKDGENGIIFKEDYRVTLNRIKLALGSLIEHLDKPSKNVQKAEVRELNKTIIGNGTSKNNLITILLFFIFLVLLYIAIK